MSFLRLTYRCTVHEAGHDALINSEQIIFAQPYIDAPDCTYICLSDGEAIIFQQSFDFMRELLIPPSFIEIPCIRHDRTKPAMPTLLRRKNILYSRVGSALTHEEPGESAIYVLGDILLIAGIPHDELVALINANGVH